jgi:hypothetical protein
MTDKSFDMTPSFPDTARGRAMPAATYNMRRRHKLNVLFLSVTPWASGLTVAEGDFVSIGQTLWQATSSGTSGSTQPQNSGDSDGGVTYVVQSIMSLQQYLYQGVPTP